MIITEMKRELVLMAATSSWDAANECLPVLMVGVRLSGRREICAELKTSPRSSLLGWAGLRLGPGRGDAGSGAPTCRCPPCLRVSRCCCEDTAVAEGTATPAVSGLVALPSGGPPSQGWSEVVISIRLCHHDPSFLP